MLFLKKKNISDSKRQPEKVPVSASHGSGRPGAGIPLGGNPGCVLPLAALGPCCRSCRCC